MNFVDIWGEKTFQENEAIHAKALRHSVSWHMQRQQAGQAARTK